MRGLSGKVAVVAGGGGGIGAATAKRLAEEGASVVIGDVFVEAAVSVAETIVGKGGSAVAVEFDMCDAPSIMALMNFAAGRFGGLDLLHVNAADMSLVSRDADAVETPLEVFDRTIAVSLRGSLLCARAAIPHMLNKNGGALVFTSSVASFLGEPERVSYGVSKSGINALMRHVSSRWGKQNIRANAVAPGPILTEKAAAMMTPELTQHFLQLTPSPRLGCTADVAGTVAFLLSEEADWISGQLITIDGGWNPR